MTLRPGGVVAIRGSFVANDERSCTALARWQPRLGKWTFANAAQAFAVTHYSLAPIAPAPLALA